MLRPQSFARAVAVCVRTLAITAALVTMVHAQRGVADSRYRVSSTSVIALDRAPQPALVDTIVTNSLVRITISGASELVAAMSIDSLQQMSTGMVRRSSDAFASGPGVTAVLRDGRPTLVGDSATACGTERPLAGLLPELLPLLPAELLPNQQWSDTVTVTTCRAGLPVTTTAVTMYRSLSGIDSSTVLLERKATLRAAGSAVIREQTVTLRGSGLSESLGVVVLGTRRLQSWRGTQSLEIELTNGQQTRRLIQQITDNATLVP